MKFGDQFKQESVAQWGPHNIDYNELKQLIKQETTKDQSKAIAIPGHDDVALLEFEDFFYKELCCQHVRVDMFTRSKEWELKQRLAHSQKDILRITSKITYGDGSGPTSKQLERLDKCERIINKCNEDIKNLERFINAQRTAFRKILKKYNKWTGSSRLTRRFTEEKLDDPKSFTQRSLQPLYAQYAEANAAIRLVSPMSTPNETPTHSIRKSKARKQRERLRREQEAASIQRGWNEYDDGSEAGEQEEPYLITIYPSTTSFPGLNTMSQKLRSWFRRDREEAQMTETAPLLSDTHAADMSPGSRGGYSTISPSPSGLPPGSRGTSQTDTSSLSSSSSEFPQTGYLTHYARFPSPSDQLALKTAEQLRTNISIGSFVVAFILLFISTLMLFVGKHKLRMEVDVGVIVGVIASVVAAVCGMVSCVYRERAGWGSVAVAGLAFVVDGVGVGVVLVVVMGRSAVWGK